MKKNFLLLVVIAVVLYIPTWRNGFVWDDEEQVVNNPYIRNFQYLGEAFSGSTFGGGGANSLSGGYYKPLLTIWAMIMYQLWGLHAGGWHFCQSVVHGINSGLLYLLFGKLFEISLAFPPKADRHSPLVQGRVKLKPNFIHKLPFFAALLWLVHPVNVESVAYIASIQEVLVMFFGLLSWLVIIYRDRFKLDDTTSLFMSSIFWLGAILSKEAGVVFPLVITTYLWLVERKKKLVGYYWFLMIPMVTIYAVLRFGVAHVVVKPNLIIPVAQLTFGQRLLTMGSETLWQHVKSVVWPVELYIGQHQVVKDWSLRTVIRIIGVLGVIGVLISLTVRQLVSSTVSNDKKNKETTRLLVYPSAVFLTWLVLSLGLTSNIFPLDMTFAERWSYIPLAAGVGWCMSTLALQSSVFRDQRKQKIIVLGCLGLLGVLVTRTVIREFDWKDGLTLFGHDIKYAKNAFDLENNYGVELMRVGRMSEAKPHFENSVKLAPKWWTNYSNLGVVYLREGNEDKAMELYKQSIANGQYFLAYENLASVLVKQKRIEEATKVINEGIKVYPNNNTLRELYLYINNAK